MTGTMISAKRTQGTMLDDSKAQVDMARLRAYRLGRLQDKLRERDYAAAVLFDPINIRYATGSRNMAVWTLHNAARYAVVPAEGKATLFDFHNCAHLSEHLETIDRIRPARSWFFFVAGALASEKVKLWAAEIDDVVRSFAGDNRRLAFDHLDPMGLSEMERLGYSVHDAQECCELARAIKSDDEIVCMNHALTACDVGMARMREALRPGVTENAVWAELHDANIRLGGEWIETRLLSSGGRTNPWFQEASDRLIRPGDLVSFDTDMIGPYGYCADVSRTFFCGPGRPSGEQKTLYALAMEQIHFNLELVKDGVDFLEFAEKAWAIPDRYLNNRYSSVAHGVGLCDEWPVIGHTIDDRAGYAGRLQSGMTICIESYIGEEGGAEGVKLEQQVLVTDTGYELLSTFPFEEALM